MSERTIDTAEPEGGLQIVAAPADGWCEPDTGVCHIDPTDETSGAEALDDTAAHDAPRAAER